jgi:hypothetical protein
MKAKLQLAPRVTTSLKLKTTLYYTAASVALLSLVGIVTFTFLNLGKSEDAFAASTSYSSVTSGNWTTSSVWANAMVPPVSNITGDEITISNGHSVLRSGNLSLQNDVTLNIEENATLTINGNFVAQNNLTINNSGKLIITGSIIAQNGATITITGTGKINVSANGTFGNNATITVSGTLNVGGSVTLGNNGIFQGAGTIGIAGTGCNKWSGPGVCSTGPVVLPVELLNFAASDNEDGSVVITWATASELNNDFFTIQRSTDGTTYSDIGTVKGNGTTKLKMSYEYQDTEPSAEKLYYRLMQTDFDGTTEVFKPVYVEVKSSGSETVSVFPNPFVGNDITIKLSKSEAGTIHITDSKGYIILTKHVDRFTTEIPISFGSDLNPGMYHVYYKTKTGTEAINIIKK